MQLCIRYTTSATYQYIIFLTTLQTGLNLPLLLMIHLPRDAICQGVPPSFSLLSSLFIPIVLWHRNSISPISLHCFWWYYWTWKCTINCRKSMRQFVWVLYDALFCHFKTMPSIFPARYAPPVLITSQECYSHQPGTPVSERSGGFSGVHLLWVQELNDRADLLVNFTWFFHMPFIVKWLTVSWSICAKCCGKFLENSKNIPVGPKKNSYEIRTRVAVVSTKESQMVWW